MIFYVMLNQSVKHDADTQHTIELLVDNTAKLNKTNHKNDYKFFQLLLFS